MIFSIFCVLICISLEKYLQVLCPFVSWVIFLLLNFKSSLYILDTSYLSVMWFAYIFSRVVGYLFTFLMVLFIPFTALEYSCLLIESVPSVLPVCFPYSLLLSLSSNLGYICWNLKVSLYFRLAPALSPSADYLFWTYFTACHSSFQCCPQCPHLKLKLSLQLGSPSHSFQISLLSGPVTCRRRHR